MKYTLALISVAAALLSTANGQILAANDGDPLDLPCNLRPEILGGPLALDRCSFDSILLPPDAFQIRYAANLTSTDAVINITNAGVNGAALNGPGFGSAAGNMCANVYTFSPDEQLVSCCSCLITPNGLISLSVNNDLISNTLTGVRPNSVVIKILSTSASSDFAGTSCTNSAALAGTVQGFKFAGGIRAWGTTAHAGPAVGSFATTETPFLIASLKLAEFLSITNRCTNIIGNGSSFGLCRSCRSGGLAAGN